MCREPQADKGLRSPPQASHTGIAGFQPQASHTGIAGFQPNTIHLSCPPSGITPGYEHPDGGREHSSSSPFLRRSNCILFSALGAALVLSEASDRENFLANFAEQLSSKLLRGKNRSLPSRAFAGARAQYV